MTITDLLAELRKLDVHLTLDGDRLRLNAPSGVLTDQHKQEIALRKAEVVAFLQQAQQLAGQQRAIVPLQSGGTRIPIFAVAGHNGDVFAYRALAHHLGEDQPFFGLQPPGIEDGSRPLTRVEDIADYFADQIRAFRPDGPVSIAGYCAGGSIAFELARRLQISGVRVTNLILFGAPFCKGYRRIRWVAMWARYYVRRTVTHTCALLASPAGGRRRYLAERARTMLPHNNIEPSDPVLIRRGNVEQATMVAVRAYSPTPSQNRIDIMVPCESWKRSWAHPLRWRNYGRDTTVYVGPADCTSDSMLLPAHAAQFAAFVTAAQQRHSRRDLC